LGRTHATGARISQFPQQNFEPYQPPALPVALSYATTPPKMKWTVVFCWIVIWGSVFLIAGMPYVRGRPRVVEPSSLQLKFSSRYAVGLKALSPQAFASGNSK